MTNLERIRPLLPFTDENLILCGYRGSIAHGTYESIDSIDDKDILGVIIPPLEYGIGIKHYEQTERFDKDIDLLTYDFRKFIKLMKGNNPNVMSLLYLESNLYLKRTNLGNRLIENRKVFISKLCYNTYCGYAYSQLHKMTHWNKEDAYVKIPHMGAKRKEIAEKFGYDTKNASHLIRLLNMGIEILSTGEVNVMRKDAALYLEIKRGEWTLQQIEQEANRLFVLIKEALIHSKLQDRPDNDKIDELSLEILKDFYGIN